MSVARLLYQESKFFFQGWSTWGAWSHCLESCFQRQERTCTKPPPANGGALCSGNDFQEQDCSGDFCPDKSTFLSSLSSQPALATGLGVVIVFFFSAIVIGIVVLRRVRTKNSKVFKLLDVFIFSVKIYFSHEEILIFFSAS